MCIYSVFIVAQSGSDNLAEQALVVIGDDIYTLFKTGMYIDAIITAGHKPLNCNLNKVLLSCLQGRIRGFVNTPLRNALVQYVDFSIISDFRHFFFSCSQ